ncbi:hypothetical protein [Ferrimonas balearica]|uniref:hypothetical protein n=1 Tax=Ferrimonas balearica TaxID=44012 RepID=UPI001C98E981|nr:hypothetical protein [Ferrimonas balearica]MBY5992496.1 hypothetical protein [Ferrimonas balearica]
MIDAQSKAERRHNASLITPPPPTSISIGRASSLCREWGHWARERDSRDFPSAANFYKSMKEAELEPLPEMIYRFSELEFMTVDRLLAQLANDDRFRHHARVVFAVSFMGLSFRKCAPMFEVSHNSVAITYREAVALVAGMFSIKYAVIYSEYRENL